MILHKRKFCRRISDFIVGVVLRATKKLRQPMPVYDWSLYSIYLPQAIGLFVRWLAVMGMDREKEKARELALSAALYSDNL